MLAIERQLLTSIRRGLEEASLREGRVLELMDQMMLGLADVEAGVWPSTVDLLRKQELDYLAGNRGRKEHKDDLGDEEDAHERDPNEEDVGAVFSSLDRAIERTVETLEGEL